MKQTRESLGLDKLFSLIDAAGDFGNAMKRNKLAHPHNKLKDVQEDYHRCAMLISVLEQNPATAAKLEEIFSHLQELPLEHYRQTNLLQMHELFELKSFLWQYRRLCNELEKAGLGTLHPLPNLDELFNLLDPEANGLPGFRISPLYSSVLSGLIERQYAISLQLKATRKHDLQEAAAILSVSGLKDEFVLSRNKQDAIAKLLGSNLFVLTQENLANLSFRLADSPQALALKQELEAISVQIKTEETLILSELSTKVLSFYETLVIAWHSTKELCWVFMRAVFAISYHCCIPKLLAWDEDSFPGIKLCAAVNLPLKQHLGQRHHGYQALDIHLDNAINLITGPNMGGKSTALITIGQLCYLAGLGIPLPAKSASLPLYDHIYYNHVSYDGSETLSSFGKEVVAFVTALNKKGRSLMLLDEFAKGTNPTEGEALCVAVIKHLSNTEHSLVAATHFSAPTKLQGIAHFSIKGISEDSFKRLAKLDAADMKQRLKLLSEAMDYSLVPQKTATPPPRCAYKIASLLGMPEEITGILPNQEDDEK